MVNIVLVEKNNELKSCKFNSDRDDELYKKCKFKKNVNFGKIHTWKPTNNKYSFKSVSIYARDIGKANTENKYDLPPPVDTALYFGTMAIVAFNEHNIYVDLSIAEWNKFYEELFGGFENLADTAYSDELEKDELDVVSTEMKTKSGYLKDGFVVEDNELQEDESEGDCSYISSELQYEDYAYSDDE
jgi:hypothetical protein